MYVLNVDLWSEDALKEVNLVRHTTATPSISSTSPASYAQIEQSAPTYSHMMPSSRDLGYPQQMAYPPPGQVVSPYGMQQQYAQGEPSHLRASSPFLASLQEPRHFRG
jgi:hypothetical protein